MRVETCEVQLCALEAQMALMAAMQSLLPCCCSSWATSESTFFQTAGLPLAMNPYHMTIAL